MDEIRLFTLTIALELERINQSKLQSCITREKDPYQLSLEKDVLSKLALYSTENKPAPSQKPHLPCDNKTLTPEEALKELKEMESKGLI